MGVVGIEEGIRGCLDADWKEGHVHFESACLEGGCCSRRPAFVS